MKIRIAITLCLAFALSLTSCQKEVKAPLNVSVDDMSAVLGTGKVDVQQVLAYAPVFVEDFEAQVDEAKEKSDKDSRKELEADTKSSKNILHSLNKIVAQIDGEDAMTLNRSIKKLERVISRSESYLREGDKPVAANKSASHHSSHSSSHSSAPTGSGSYFNIEDLSGYTNIRNRPNGSVCMRLYAWTQYNIYTCGYRDGWYQISAIYNTKKGYWVNLHSSSTGTYWIAASVLM